MRKTTRNDVCDGVGHTGLGPCFQCDVSVPGICNGSLHFMRLGINPTEERAMLPVSSVVRFPLGFFQIARDEIAVHGIEDRAMKEQGITLAPLGVPRDFHPADRQIADALEGDGRLPAMERAGDPLEDELIGAADVREVRMQRERQHERIR